MNKAEFIEKRKNDAYAKRLGQVYRDYRVKEIEWSEEKKKQVWTLECVHCGATRTTTAWQNYTSGRSGDCKKCKSASNSMIGLIVDGWKIERCWGDGEKAYLEVRCLECGCTRKTNYAELMLKGIRCEHGKYE